jgi:tetratricopeptide (TPR) repeat protein
MRKIADITLLVVILFSAIPLFPETAEQMDSRAQAHFDRKEYASAIALWLTILDIDPTNERIQQKVEMIYEVKQKKDVAMQKAKLYFKIAMKIIGDNYEEGKQKAQQALRIISWLPHGSGGQGASGFKGGYETPERHDFSRGGAPPSFKSPEGEESPPEDAGPEGDGR